MGTEKKRNHGFTKRLLYTIKASGHVKQDGTANISGWCKTHLGFSSSNFTPWKRGYEPDAPMLFRLADALGVDPRWLLLGDGKPAELEVVRAKLTEPNGIAKEGGTYEAVGSRSGDHRGSVFRRRRKR